MTRPVPARFALAGGLSRAFRQHESERRDAGVTLIEMLVVLAIVAVMASVTVLAVGGDSGRAGQAEAKRLQSRLQFAADRAMITDSTIALLHQSDGYSFVERDGDGGDWQPIVAGSLGTPHELPGGMTLAASDGRQVLPIGAYAGSTFELTLASGGRSWTVAFDGMTAQLANAAKAPPQ